MRKEILIDIPRTKKYTSNKIQPAAVTYCGGFLLEVILIYIYPENLKAKAMLWLWELRDLGIVGLGVLLSVFAIAQVGSFTPLMITAVFAFLSIRLEDHSLLDFLRYAVAFLFLQQQYFEWRQESE